VPLLLSTVGHLAEQASAALATAHAEALQAVRAAEVTEIGGVRMKTYIDWMKSCYLISAVGNPALAVPCAFTDGGLPVGLQIVGRHQDDWGVLQLGHAFEQATGLLRRRPLLATKESAQA
jgi:amidase